MTTGYLAPILRNTLRKVYVAQKIWLTHLIRWMQCWEPVDAELHWARIHRDNGHR